MTGGNEPRDNRQKLWQLIMLGVVVAIVIAAAVVLAVDALRKLSLTF